MPTHFELVSEMNRRRTKNGYDSKSFQNGLKRGVGGVTMDSPNDPNTTGYGPLAPLFSGSGRQFMNQCRTPDNPAGWVPGTGGWDHPNPLDMGPGPGGNWPQWYWDANQMDAQIQHGAYLRSTGAVCPSTQQQIAAAAAASPFITPSQPANSPYGVVTNPQPLLKSFYDQPSAASVAAANRTSGGSGGTAMQIQFNASRSGNTFYVGDTWNIVITGAPPNSVVKESTTPFGNTDSSGNWSKSGTFDSSVVGNWNENWTVGGTPIGSWNFTVVAGSAPPINAQTYPLRVTTGGIANSNSNMASGASALGTDTAGFLTGEMITGIPNWAILAGVLGVAAMFMMGEESHRR